MEIFTEVCWRNSKFTTGEAYHILYDDIDSDGEDFEELNIVNTNEDDVIDSDMTEDQSENQLLNHCGYDDKDKLLQIIFVIYREQVI